MQIFTYGCHEHETSLYTMSQKTVHLTFDYNLDKCRSILRIILLTDSQGNSICNYCRVFHLTLTVCCYTTLCLCNLKITIAADLMA